MASKDQNNIQTPPVPVEKHYVVVKRVEEDIKNHLGELEYDALLLVGLRVSYDVPSDQEQSTLPFKVEFGYLEALDCAMDCEQAEEVDEQEWEKLTQGILARNPMPIEVLDRFYEMAKKGLEEASGGLLTVAVHLVLFGSPLMGYSVGCLCKKGGKKTKKYCYYDKKKHKTKCYCSRVEC